MSTRIVSAVTTSLLLAVAAAQAPGEATRPAAATEMVTLQQLVGDTVWSRQPLQSPPTPAPAPAPAPAPGSDPAPGPAPSPQPHGQGQGQGPQGNNPHVQGSVADRPFAVVRDAQFAADGQLVALVVEAPAAAGAARDATARILPAKSVQWDGATRRWLTAPVTLQLAELAAHEPGKPPKPAPTPAPAPVGRTMLASDLLTATWSAPKPTDGAVATDASARKGDAAPRVVWWLAPAHQQLAFAVVPHGERLLAIPWPALRTNANGAQVETRLENPASASDAAPAIASATEPPSAELRRRCYEHYGAPTPRWDRAEEPAKPQRKTADGATGR